jgi:type I restriction enzyme S subunit
METVIDKQTIQKYPAYKDSGVDWIENIPSHWEVKKFKRIFYEVKKRSNPELNCGSISFGKVVYKDDEKIPESTKKSYQVVQKGDFLVNPLNLNYDLISLRIALSDIDVVVSSGYIVLSNFVKLDKTFYKYFLHRFDVAFMKLLGSGVRQTLNWNDIANCDLIFPPISEQTAIAAFLDRKTALIDQAIEIKQKQIELLKERRQILIHQAVTHGLNPNVKLKDSGVEWIGEIPEGWEVKKIKDILIEKKYTRNLNLNCGSISYGKVVYKNDESILLSTKKSYQEVLKGEFLINPLNLNYDLKSLRIALSDKDVVVSSGYIVLNTKIEINKTFLNWLLHRFDIVFMKTLGSGVRQTLNYNDIAQCQLATPKLKEQIEIASYIETNTRIIEHSISLKEQEIEKLKEYKASLINSAVTGKIKVC